jgi:hypothetical protein
MPEAVVLPFLVPALGEGGAIAFYATATKVLAVAGTLAYGANQQNKARRLAESARRDLKVVLQTGVEPHRTVYGRAKLSGPLVYAYSFGTDHNILIRVIALTGHEIDAYEVLYFNDEAVQCAANDPASVNENDMPFSASTGSIVTNERYYRNGMASAAVEFFMGTTGQAASSALISNSGGQWTSNHRLRGRAYVVVQNNYSQDIYTEGLPNVQVVIRGKKLYDPRSATTYWNRNPALVIRDYLLNVLNVDAARLDEASFIAAANVCDEYVTLDTAAQSDPTQWAAYMTAAATAGTWEHVSGTTYRQRRYTFDGVVTSDASPGDILEQMVFACAGYLSYTGGAWRLIAGSYQAPTLTLTESDLRGGPQFQPRPSRRDLVNMVRGQFVGPMNKYEATDFHPLKATALIADDGGIEMPMDLDLPFTADSAACQRLASIFLYRSRQGVLNFPATLTALALRPGDTVAVNLSRFGFSGQVFRVEGWSLAEDLGVDLVLREEAASIYTWTPTTTIVDPSPQLNLPNPWVVPVVGNLSISSGVGAALIQNDGTIIQRTLVAWTPSTNAFATKVEIETRITGSMVWTPYPMANDADGQAYILNLKTGAEHEFRVRRLNAIGARSDWATITYTPLPVNMSDNLLKNSDWTEDIGYGSGLYSDARALRHWLAGGIGAFEIGRNFDAGRQWNIGAGGAWMHSGAWSATDYEFIYQTVPGAAGVTYEASVYVAAQRCAVSLILRFLNAGGATISDAMGGSDQIDAGTGILGSQFDPMSNPRLWRSGTAPVGTASVQVILIKSTTTSGQSDSYAFWSKSLLCVAPTGVTRETATPWTPNSLNTAYTGPMTDSKPADGSVAWNNANPAFAPSYSYTIATVSYTNNGNIPLPIVVVYSALVSWTNSGLQYGGAGVTVNLNGVVSNPEKVDIFGTNEATPTRALISGTYSVTIPAGQTFTASLSARGDRFAPGTNTTTLYYKNVQLNLQGTQQ